MSPKPGLQQAGNIDAVLVDPGTTWKQATFSMKEGPQHSAAAALEAVGGGSEGGERKRGRGSERGRGFNRQKPSVQGKWASTCSWEVKLRVTLS